MAAERWQIQGRATHLQSHVEGRLGGFDAGLHLLQATRLHLVADVSQLA
jgi:hypothetical protein